MDFKDKTVSVLGTEYKICFVEREQDELLNELDGYCDHTVKKIVVTKPQQAKYSLENLNSYTKKVIRHELIHAFMYESGLDGNVEHKSIGIEETFVDWIAIQFPKIKKAFKEVGCV